MNTDSPLNILLVEENEDDYLQLKNHLSAPKYGLTWTKNSTELPSMAGEQDFDVIITGALPDSPDGRGTIRAMKQKWPYVPVIILTGGKNNTAEIEALKIGASGCLSKDAMDASSVEQSITYAMKRASVYRSMRDDETYKDMMNKITNTGKVAKMLAHEIKNPLARIFLCVEQLKDTINENAEADFYIGLIEQASQEIDKLMNDLVSSTRIGNLVMKKSDLVSVMKEALANSVARVRPKSINVLEDYPMEPVQLEMDEDQLKGALQHLITNALEASDEEHGVVELRLTQAYGQAMISIRDNGKGISPEAKENLFIPYFSTKPHGSGLGLTAAQNVVLGHKGKIEVKSEFGKGAEFLVSIPLE